jgi:hypothetical protein
MRMLYVVKSFCEDDAGERRRLRSLGYEAPSEERAVRYAQAFLRNATVHGKQPTVCLVKNLGGKVVSVVSAQSPAMQADKQKML